MLEIFGYRFKVFKRSYILKGLLLTCSLPASCWAGTATLAWDPPTTGTVAGYNLYYTQATTLDKTAPKVDVGNKTTTATPTLQDGATYSFGLTSYDASKNESALSNTVTYTVPVPPTPTTAPTPTPAPVPTPSNPPPTAANNTGLVAAYALAESGTTVLDASGNGNHGVITGAVRTNAGKFGATVNFDGVNNWITIPDAPSLDLTTGMTLEAWVYPTQTMSGWNTVIMKEKAAGLSYYMDANSDSDTPAAGMDNIGGGRNLEGGHWLIANQWAHLAATYDGATQRLYVDGTQVASQPQTGLIQTSDGALRIGGNSIWGEWFAGRIDEIRIYNRALNAAEIQNDLGKSVFETSPPTLLGGTKAIGHVAGSIPAGTAQAFSTSSGTTAGRVAKLSVYVGPFSTATQLMAGIYADAGGRPGKLLGNGTLASPKTSAWNEVAMPATQLTANTRYWIAVLVSGGELRFQRAGTGAAELSAGGLAYLPANWTAAARNNDGPISANAVGW